MTEEMQTKTCPYCGEEININAIKCKHCGEFLNENQQEQTTEPETKICPFCGEEIAYKAVKCKHCGEFLNKQISSDRTNNDKIDRLNIDESWKKRFILIDKYYIDGYWYKPTDEYNKMPRKEISRIYNAIVFDWGTFIAAFLFGLFYYLFKGMWLKALVYSIVILILDMILLILIPSLGATTYTLSIIFAMFAPFDYYRLKVLGKQW